MLTLLRNHIHFYWLILLLHKIILYVSESMVYKLIITIDDKIKDETLQYDINREAAKILTLSLGKTEKYEYLIWILPAEQITITEHAKFTHFPLEKGW